MRKGSIIGALAFAAAASLSFLSMGAGMSTAAAEIAAAKLAEAQRHEGRLSRRDEYAARWRRPARLKPLGCHAQRHTGAGSGGMHRAWKKRRASGRS